MGLFSSKKKTYVYTSVSRMLDDDSIYLSGQSAIIEHVMGSTIQVGTDPNEMSLTDRIQDGAMNSMPSKIRGFYQGAKSGNYHYGLPKTSVVFSDPDELKTALLSSLSETYSGQITLDYFKLDDPNPFHITMKILLDRYGFNTTSNQLTVLSTWLGHTCYLQDIEMHYCPDTLLRVEDTEYFAQYGRPATYGQTHLRALNPDAEHTVFVEDVDATQDFARVSYTYRDAQGQDIVQTMDVTFEGYIVSGAESDLPGVNEDPNLAVSDPVNEDLYVMAGFTTLYNGVTTYHYFSYKLGSGEYSQLEELLDGQAEIGEFYPRIYARLEGTNLAADALRETPAYKSSMKIAKRLGLTWNSWVDEIHDGVESIGEVCQCYLMLGARASAKDPVIQEYLFKYFSNLYQMGPKRRKFSISGLHRNEFADFAVRDGAAHFIKDNVFTQKLAYDGIGIKDVVGVIGLPGTYKGGLNNSRATSGSFFGAARLAYKPYHYYQYQITPTTYREVRVYNLSLSQQVSGGYWTTATGNSEELLVPLDHTMYKAMSSKDRELLFAKSLYFVFNTLKVVKTKWYQRGVFKAIMFIVAVVLAIPSGGGSLALLAIAIAVVKSIVLSLVFKLLAKLAVKIGISVEIVAALALVAAVYGGYLAASNTTGIMQMSAKSILEMSNQAFSFASTVGAEQMKGIVKEMQEFKSYAETKQEELDKANQLLKNADVSMNLGLFVDAAPPSSMPYLNLYQTPHEYYTRTVHAGNVGPLAFAALSGYVDQSLVLPKLADTVNVFEQGT